MLNAGAGPSAAVQAAFRWACQHERNIRIADRGPRFRVLVVEDEAKVAAAVRRGLEAEGFAVDVAGNGDDGRWMAEEHEYDALILDIMLPRMSGTALCAHLRSIGDWTPILMLTARDGELDEANALDAGADDYLTKPFSFVVLLARVRALVRRGQAVRPAVLEVGSIRLDPAAHRCWRNEDEVALTAREFAVLEFLLRREGDVVSKAAILENVWDFNFDGDPNIVEVYVRHLRRKLDRDESPSVIETVRGAGYRLATGS